MLPEEKFFIDRMDEIKISHQELNPEAFDNLIDYNFKKSALESELQAYQSASVEHKKFVIQSSPEEAAIMMHSTCVGLSDKFRTELGALEKFENQEDETITMNRGRCNGLINGYNSVRIYFSSLTSEYAAARERSKV